MEKTVRESNALDISEKWANLRKQCHLQSVQQQRKTYTPDVFAEVWAKATEDHKRLLLRVAFLDENPTVKSWGAYSETERKTLHTFGLWLEEFADFQKAVKREAKAFERKINAPD